MELEIQEQSRADRRCGHVWRTSQYALTHAHGCGPCARTACWPGSERLGEKLLPVRADLADQAPGAAGVPGHGGGYGKDSPGPCPSPGSTAYLTPNPQGGGHPLNPLHPPGEPHARAHDRIPAPAPPHQLPLPRRRRPRGSQLEEGPPPQGQTGRVAPMAARAPVVALHGPYSQWPGGRRAHLLLLRRPVRTQGRPPPPMRPVEKSSLHRTHNWPPPLESTPTPDVQRLRLTCSFQRFSERTLRSGSSSDCTARPRTRSTTQRWPVPRGPAIGSARLPPRYPSPAAPPSPMATSPTRSRRTTSAFVASEV